MNWLDIQLILENQVLSQTRMQWSSSKLALVLASKLKHGLKMQDAFQGHNQSEIRTHKALIKKHFMNE